MGHWKQALEKSALTDAQRNALIGAGIGGLGGAGLGYFTGGGRGALLGGLLGAGAGGGVGYYGTPYANPVTDRDILETGYETLLGSQSPTVNYMKNFQIDQTSQTQPTAAREPRNLSEAHQMYGPRSEKYKEYARRQQAEIAAKQPKHRAESEPSAIVRQDKDMTGQVRKMVRGQPAEAGAAAAGAGIGAVAGGAGTGGTMPTALGSTGDGMALTAPYGKNMLLRQIQQQIADAERRRQEAYEAQLSPVDRILLATNEAYNDAGTAVNNTYSDAGGWLGEQSVAAANVPGYLYDRTAGDFFGTSREAVIRQRQAQAQARQAQEQILELQRQLEALQQ